MLNRLRPLIVAVCLFVTAGVLVGPALAQQQQTVAQVAGAKLDAARVKLTDVEKSLANKDLSDTALQALRNDLDPTTQSVQDALSELQTAARRDQVAPRSARPETRRRCASGGGGNDERT